MFERIASEPPRSSVALTALKHIPAASAVTFGRDSSNHPDNPHRDANMADFETSGRATGPHFPDRIGWPGDFLPARRPSLEARVGQFHAIQHRSAQRPFDARLQIARFFTFSNGSPAQTSAIARRARFSKSVSSSSQFPRRAPRLRANLPDIPAHLRLRIHDSLSSSIFLHHHSARWSPQF